MANEVTIIVKDRDKTDFSKYGPKAKREIGKGVEEGLDDVDKKTTDRFSQIGDRSGKALGDKVSTSMKKPIEDGLTVVDKKTTEKFREVGDHSGKAMGSKIEDHMKNWSKIWGAEIPKPLYDSFDKVTEHVDVVVKEKFRKVGEHGGQSLGAGLEGAVESVTRVGRRAGDSAGSSFAKSLSQAGSTIAGAWIPLLIAALLPELPAIGALAATALVFAFGAGLAGLGLAAAFQLKSVKKEFAQFKKFLSGFMKDIGKPFAETWATIFNVAGNGLKKLQPLLKGVFKDFIAPAVSRFVISLAEAFSKLAPSIRPVAKAFAALLDTLGPRLPGIFKGIADAITGMANQISKNPKLFAGFLSGLLQLIPASLKIIGFLSKLFDKFSKFEHSSNPFKLMLAAVSPLLAILMHLGVAGKVFHAIGDAAKTIGPKIGDLFDKIKEKAGPVLGKIGDQIKKDLVPAFVDFVHAAAPLAGKLIAIFTPTVVATITDILHAVSGLLDLLSGFLKISGGLLSGNWSKMWDGMKDVAKGGAKIIGASIKSLLNSLTGGHGDKVIKITLSAVNKVSGPVKSAISTAAGFAKRVYRANLSALNRVGGPVRSAISSCTGFARRAYRANLNALNRVGGPVRSAISACAGFARRAYRANLTALNRVGAALRAAISLGNQWAHRVFTATFNVFKSINPFNAHGGIIGGLATGGMPRGQAGGGPGGSLTWVGEQGAELVRLPTGSQVYPHGQSEGMAARAGGGGGPIVLELRSSGSRLDDFLLELFRNAIRVRGGNVQVVLGK